MARINKDYRDAASKKRRQAQLQRIGGFWPSELTNYTIKGRERVIHVLTQHEQALAKIQKEMPQFYDIARHIEIAALIAKERAAIEELKNRSAKISAGWQRRFSNV
jgi:hypothetical protein